MQFDLITIFPEFFTGPLDYGIVRRARETRLVDVRVHDLRAFTHDRHRTVDDRPFGGGEGMVLKPEPLFEAVESLLGAEMSNQRKRSARNQHGALFCSPPPENFSARRQRGASPRSTASSCCAAATKAWTSALPNIWPPTNSPLAILCFPAANWPRPWSSTRSRG